MIKKIFTLIIIGLMPLVSQATSTVDTRHIEKMFPSRGGGAPFTYIINHTEKSTEFSNITSLQFLSALSRTDGLTFEIKNAFLYKMVINISFKDIDENSSFYAYSIGMLKTYSNGERKALGFGTPIKIGYCSKTQLDCILEIRNDILQYTKIDYNQRLLINDNIKYRELVDN